MEQTAVPDPYFRAAHQALAHVAAPGAEAADQQQVDEQVHVASHRRRRDAETRSQPRLIQERPLPVRQHPPQPRDRLGGKPRREHRHVALQIAPDKIPPPGERVGVPSAQGGTAGNRRAPRASRGQGPPAGSSRGNRWGQFDVADPPRQRLGGLPHQVERGGPEQTGSRRAGPPLSGGRQPPAQDGEQLRSPVDFIDHHQLAGLGAQVDIGVLEPAAVGRAFQVEVDRVRVVAANRRASVVLPTWRGPRRTTLDPATSRSLIKPATLLGTLICRKSDVTRSIYGIDESRQPPARAVPAESYLPSSICRVVSCRGPPAPADPAARI